MKHPFLASALLVLGVGCAGSGQASYSASATYTAPQLILIEPDVQVVADYDEPVFYSENYYWRYDNGVWYRSNNHLRGWVRFEAVPARIRRIERPTAYIRYRGEARGQARGPEVRDHRDHNPPPPAYNPPPPVAQPTPPPVYNPPPPVAQPTPPPRPARDLREERKEDMKEIKEQRKDARQDAKEERKEAKAEAKAEAKDNRADAKEERAEAKAAAKMSPKDAAKLHAKDAKQDAKEERKEAKAEAKADAKDDRHDAKEERKDAAKAAKKNK